MKLVLATVLALAMASGPVLAGGGGAGGAGGAGVGGAGGSGLPGSNLPGSNLPGNFPGNLPLPPGSGAQPGAPGAPQGGGTDRPESRAQAALRQATSVLREAFAHTQEGMAKGLSQAMEAIQSSVK